MDARTIALLGGLLFLLLAIVGGGFAIREIKMPSIPGWARVACLLVGAALVVPWFLTEVRSDQEAIPPAGVSRRSAPSVPEGEIIHADSDAHLSPDGVEVSGLLATGRGGQAAVGDRIMIQFSLRNVGTKPLTFEATFVGVRNPDRENKDFGHENTGQVSEAGSVVTIKQSILVDAPGAWEFFPCYMLRSPDGDIFCPDEWRAFEVLVR